MITLKQGMKRPEVKILQNLLDCKVDGWLGEKTEVTLKQKQYQLGLISDGICGKNTWNKILTEKSINHLDLIQSIICRFEIYNKGYGMAEDDIGDNAGANYGILQHNKYGSMKTLLKLADREDLLEVYYSTDLSKVNPTIKDWFGSSEGIKFQDKYFEKYIYNKAVDELDILVDTLATLDLQEKFRIIGMFCDSIVQNGTMFSPNKAPFTENPKYKGREFYEGEEWDVIFGNLIPFSKLKEVFKRQDKEKREANISTIIELLTIIIDQPLELKLELVAQYRARTSSYKWWRVVLARRQIWSQGQGILYGSNINLKDYYIKYLKPFEIF